jgi:hypothetical protein
MTFNYVLPAGLVGETKRTRLKFTYMPASLSRNLDVAVKSKTGSTSFRIPMKGGWNGFVSEPLAMPDSRIAVSFASDVKPVPLSGSDPRPASFLIKNLEVLPYPESPR